MEKKQKSQSKIKEIKSDDAEILNLELRNIELALTLRNVQAAIDEIFKIAKSKKSGESLVYLAMGPEALKSGVFESGKPNLEYFQYTEPNSYGKCSAIEHSELLKETFDEEELKHFETVMRFGSIYHQHYKNSSDKILDSVRDYSGIKKRLDDAFNSEVLRKREHLDLLYKMELQNQTKSDSELLWTEQHLLYHEKVRTLKQELENKTTQVSGLEALLLKQEEEYESKIRNLKEEHIKTLQEKDDFYKIQFLKRRTSPAPETYSKSLLELSEKIIKLKSDMESLQSENKMLRETFEDRISEIEFKKRSEIDDIIHKYKSVIAELKSDLKEREKEYKEKLEKVKNVVD